MASSYNQKSSSSASNRPKPTYRKAGRGAAPVKAPKPVKQKAEKPRKPKASGRISLKGVAPRKASATNAPAQKPVARKTVAAGGLKPHKRSAQQPTTRGIKSQAPVSRRALPVDAAPTIKPTIRPRTASGGLIKRIQKSRTAIKNAASLAAPKQAVAAASGPTHIGATVPARGVLTRAGIIVAAALFVALLGFAIFAVVANTGLFAVTDVEIASTKHVPTETTEKLLEIPDNATLLNVSEDQLAESLLENPWVKTVSIERQFPHTLVITPVEKTAAALVYIGAGDISWAVDDEGKWIAPTALGSGSASDAEADGDDDASSGNAENQDGTSEDGASGDESQEGESQEGSAEDASGREAAAQLASDLGAILVTDVGSDIDPQSGEPVTDDALVAVLSYINDFSPEFRERISSFSASSTEAISVYLTDGVEVSLGDANDIRKKEKVVDKILEERQGVTYINARNPDSPTWREVSL